jgi:hypothetical protein
MGSPASACVSAGDEHRPLGGTSDPGDVTVSEKHSNAPEKQEVDGGEGQGKGSAPGNSDDDPSRDAAMPDSPAQPRRPRPRRPSNRIIREFNDRGTLWLLEDPANLRDLLRILEPALAERLDFARAQRVNRSFIPADLRKRESDLIFRMPFATSEKPSAEVWVYVLLEHQSRPDPWMPLRLLFYMTHLWDLQRRESEAVPGERVGPPRLHPVIPVVFYTGQEGWSTGLRLAELVAAPPELERLSPAWETLFPNLHRTPPESLTRFASAVGWALRTLQVEQAPLDAVEAALQEAFTGLEGLSEEHAGQWLRVTWYLVLLAFHRRPENEYTVLQERIVEYARQSKFHLREEMNLMARTMAEACVERGRAEGEARGRVVGEAEGLRRALRTFLTGRFDALPANVAAAIAVADADTLDRWSLRAATAQTLDEVGILALDPRG